MPKRVMGRGIAILVALAVAGATACAGDDGTGGRASAGVSSSTSRATTSTVAATARDAGPLVLRSDAVAEGQKYPRGLTCEGGDVQPPLEWTGIPADAAELLLLLEDLDAPGGTFTHLVVHAMPPTDGFLDREMAPPGARFGTNDFGEPGYRGPCPPADGGRHRYVFTLLAVAEPLDLAEAATGAEARAAAEAAGVVGQATITTFYEFGLD